jgi:SpoVK/Ycf46/Vps4 family AAA+-type ATPase
MKSAINRDDLLDLPKGIVRRMHLPQTRLGALWQSIFVDESIKMQLHSQAVLNFTLRPRVDRSVLPLHGVILLVGPPGTGKTSLARGLANRTADSFNGRAFQLLEVDPHALVSSAMGRTQRAVSDLFAQSIAEVATTGPTIVLLDEVETLAADRNKLSLDANPIDVHRATDAVLVQLDNLAEDHQNLLFVATSNFPDAVDSAFMSRCDLVQHIPLPDRKACAQILSSCLSGLAEIYKPIGRLAEGPEFEQCVNACVGLDGRAIRKMVANALASRQETAAYPERLMSADLIRAAEAAKVNRVAARGAQ